jgi:hypothetical protein
MPAIPSSLTVRFGILSFYFALHYFKAQNAYAKIKNQIIYMDFTDKKEDIEAFLPEEKDEEKGL